MRSKCKLGLLVILFLTYTGVVIGSPNSVLPMSQPIVSPPTINAKSYILIDYNSHRVLAAKNIDKKIQPASLTKMMTMYVVEKELQSGKLNLQEQVLVSKKAWKAEGSRMFIDVGSKVAVSDLRDGIIISSGNDASIAIAEHIAGTEEGFAAIMNSYAKALGMYDTNFTNATGLPSKNHYTTAKDLAILATALIRDFPESYKIYSEKQHTFNNIKQYNRNRLLWRNRNVDGIKTGHTDSAGYCLVASAKISSNMRLVSVLLGAKSDEVRSHETNKLLTWGFRFFETHLIQAASNPIKNLKIWLAEKPNVDIGLLKDIYVTIPQGQYKNINTEINMPDVIKAPLKQGQKIGNLIIRLDNQVLANSDIIVLDNIKRGTMWHRLKDTVKLSFDSMFNKLYDKFS